MSDYPRTNFYESPYLEQIKNNGVMSGMKWMREQIIELISSSIDLTEEDKNYICHVVNRIDPDDFFKNASKS